MEIQQDAGIGVGSEHDAGVLELFLHESLLDSYTPERAPVGKQIVARAYQSRVDYGPINECLRALGQAAPVAAGLAKITPGPKASRYARRCSRRCR